MPQHPRVCHERPEETDVLIVGSGPVGSAAAVEIVRRDPTARVLIVEVGPALTDPPGRNQRHLADDQLATVLRRLQGPVARDYPPSGIEDRAIGTNPVGSDRLAFPGTFLVEHNRPDSAAGAPAGVSAGASAGASADVSADVSAAPDRQRVDLRAAAMAAGVGGMGVLWTGACPWPYGAERPPQLSDAELDECLDDARALLRVTQSALPARSVRARIVDALAREYPGFPEGRGPQPMPLAVDVDDSGRQHWTGPADILEAAGAGAERITIRPDTLARRIDTDGARVTGVELEDRRTGERWTTRAAAVLVAADSLRTPQLLWASGIRPPALGHYLNDHTWLVVPTGPAADHEPGEAHPGGGELLDALWMPLSEAHPFHGPIMIHGDTDIDHDDHDARSPSVSLALLVPKDIRHQDAVSFDDAVPDAFGMPAISISYGFSARDEANLERARDTLRRTRRAIEPLVPEAEPILLEPGSSQHFQGTFRMGTADDGTSVCDSDGRVWSLTNLYLGGNGIIPTATGANPTLLSVALVLRAARRIAGQLPAGPLVGSSAAHP
ncbi:MAG: GMC oxidoreductase [Nocardioides sp.]|uniref:GMC oxidoreductase n=1 Tax=Nocardioides sp. TaxID=35761 RepID=UPI0039E292A1